MREWWANVYPLRDRKAHVGGPQCAGFLLDGARYLGPGTDAMVGPVCRIHVRLKPEGAPRRYASRWERWGWENTPETMREMREREAFYGGHQWTPEQVARMTGRDIA